MANPIVQTVPNYPNNYFSELDTAFASPCTGGNSIVVEAMCQSSVDAQGVTDTDGNTYVKVVGSGGAGVAGCSIWRADNIESTGNANTVKIAYPFTVLPSCQIYETLPLGTTDQSNEANGSGNAPSTSTVTTADAGEVCFSACAVAAGDTPVSGSGWTQDGNGPGGCGQSQVQAGAGAITGTFTVTGSPFWNTTIATFPFSATPPPPGGPSRSTRSK
jgi:hypothetical protein